MNQKKIYYKVKVQEVILKKKNLAQKIKVVKTVKVMLVVVNLIVKVVMTIKVAIYQVPTKKKVIL